MNVTGGGGPTAIKSGPGPLQLQLLFKEARNGRLRWTVLPAATHPIVAMRSAHGEAHSEGS